MEPHGLNEPVWTSVIERLPLVSVITPIRNAARYLPQTVDSVLAQTYPNWELLLVDDGSTDGSDVIARKFASQHPGRIQALAQADGQRHCAGAARNTGVRHARGSLLAFLDADDVWRPDKLEFQVEELRNHPAAAAIYGRTIYWWSWNPDATVPDDNPPLGVPVGTTIRPPELFLRCLEGSAAVPCPCSFMLRREVVDEIGAWDDEFASIYDDQLFFSKIFLTYPVRISTGCLDYYRQHPDSWCHQTAAAGQLIAERMAYLERIGQYVTARRLGDTILARAVEKELYLCRNPRRLSWRNLERYVTRKARWAWLRFTDAPPVPASPELSGLK